MLSVKSRVDKRKVDEKDEFELLKVGYDEFINDIEEELVLCDCACCSFWLENEKKRVVYMVLGILLPFIWIFFLIKSIYHLSISKKPKPQSFTFKNETNLLMGTNTQAMFIEAGWKTHNCIRTKMFSWLGHMALAIVIYVLVIIMIVIFCHLRSFKGGGLFVFAL